MKTYRIKKLIEGYKIRPEMAGKEMVAVPESKFENGEVFIEHKKGIMKVNKEQAICCNTFPDRYGRGLYTLFYYVWEPKEQLNLC